MDDGWNYPQISGNHQVSKGTHVSKPVKTMNIMNIDTIVYWDIMINL